MSDIKKELETFMFAAKTGAIIDDLEFDLLIDKAVLDCTAKSAINEISFDFFSFVTDFCAKSYAARVTIENGFLQMSKVKEESKFTPIIEQMKKSINSSTAAQTITKWCIDNVIQITKKYTRAKICYSLRMNFWNGSETMRGLISILIKAMQKLSNTDLHAQLDFIIDNLYKQQHIDWLAANIGTQYPEEIIDKLLQYILQRYKSNGNSKYTVEIGVLELLSKTHEQNIKSALQKLFLLALNAKDTLHNSIVTCLLIVTKSSRVLLQLLVDTFLEMFDDQMGAAIEQHYAAWKLDEVFAEDMLPTLQVITLRITYNIVNVLIMAAKLSFKYSWCQTFVTQSLEHIEKEFFLKRSSNLIHDAVKQKELLWESCTSNNKFVQKTAINILLIASIQCDHLYTQTISYLLRQPMHAQADSLSLIVQFFEGPKGSMLHNCSVEAGLKCLFNSIPLYDQFSTIEKNTNDRGYIETLNIFQNTLQLIELAQKKKCKFLYSFCEKLHIWLEPILKTLNICINNGLEIIQSAVPKAQTSVATTATKVATPSYSNLIEIKGNYDWHLLASIIIDILNAMNVGNEHCNEWLCLSVTTVKYFMYTFTKPFDKHSCAATNCIKLLSRMCQHSKAVRTTCIRELLESALFKCERLFRVIEDGTDDVLIPKKYILAYQMNSSVPENYATSQMVGQLMAAPSAIDTLHISCNTKKVHQIFIEALCACSFRPGFELMDFAFAPLTLIELISADIHDNGLCFPENHEERKEHNLIIYRAFNKYTILWHILKLFAKHRPAVCYAAPLLRALCGACCSQWNECIDTNGNEVLLKSTKKLLDILTLAQLLPAPLSELALILHCFIPQDISIIMKHCVWNYLREYPPSLELFKPNFTRRDVVRSFVLYRIPKQYIEPLRIIILKNLNLIPSHLREIFLKP